MLLGDRLLPTDVANAIKKADPVQVVKALADFRAYALLAAPKVLDMMRSDSSLAKESLLNVLIDFAHIRGGEHKAPALTGTSTEELLKNLQGRQYIARIEASS